MSLKLGIDLGVREARRPYECLPQYLVAEAAPPASSGLSQHVPRHLLGTGKMASELTVRERAAQAHLARAPLFDSCTLSALMT